MHTEYSNNRQYITKSNTSPKKRKVRNCYKRDTNTGKYLTFHEVLSRITRKKGDFKLQTLALEIITPLNGCTGRLSRVSTRHKHNRRGMQIKVREKSRECHNHKPHPVPDTKRKRRPTNPNKHKSNKRTKTSPLLPKRGNRNTKRTEKHKNKTTHGKTYNKSHRRINHKATKNKTDTGTTALERSVE